MAQPCRGECEVFRRNMEKKGEIVSQTPQSEIRDFGQLPYRGAWVRTVSHWCVQCWLYLRLERYKTVPIF